MFRPIILEEIKRKVGSVWESEMNSPKVNLLTQRYGWFKGRKENIKFYGGEITWWMHDSQAKKWFSPGLFGESVKELSFITNHKSPPPPYLQQFRTKILQPFWASKDWVNTFALLSLNLPHHQRISDLPNLIISVSTLVYSLSSSAS